MPYDMRFMHLLGPALTVACTCYMSSDRPAAPNMLFNKPLPFNVFRQLSNILFSRANLLGRSAWCD